MTDLAAASPAAVDWTAGGPPMIEVAGASKWFGDVVAVSDVTFAVGAGVTALLGPNGAGKSTLMRMICGLTPADQGTVRILGADPRTDLAVRSRIGIVPQQEGVFEPCDAWSFVRLAAVLNGVPDPDAAARGALAVVELDPSDHRKVSQYSKGMRQRVKVAQALVNDPAVLVLDEPLTGLDPRQRAHLIELFARLGARGVSVITSSGDGGPGDGDRLAGANEQAGADCAAESHHGELARRERALQVVRLARLPGHGLGVSRRLVLAGVFGCTG